MTAADAERDALGTNDPLLATVRTVLAECGAPAERASAARSTAQSQEMVDRDYQGNWFAAMR